MTLRSKGRKGLPSAVPFVLAKVTIIVLVFLFAECAAGSCINYGHACWGAHGKRSGSHSARYPVHVFSPDDADSKNVESARWFLSRLMQKALGYQQRGGKTAIQSLRNEQFYPTDTDLFKGQDAWEDSQETDSNINEAGGGDIVGKLIKQKRSI